MNLCPAFIVLLAWLALAWAQYSQAKPDLLVVTVATEENDGFKSFLRSAKHYGLNVKVFGMGTKWQGGTMETTGGGHKINILKEELKPHRNKENLLIMFVDSYDLVFTEGKEVILDKFAKFDASVVFAAENLLWPDQSLESKYPSVKAKEKKYLNSGGFIGYAKQVYEIVNYRPIGNRDDDQLYYTEIFLNRALRHELKIKLDVRADIFMNLHGSLGEVVLDYEGDHSYLRNVETGTVPVAVHGNGPIKPEFYRMSNYLADGWTTSSGCLSCKEDLLDLTQLEKTDYPKVLLAIFVQYPTPFIREFFQRVAALDYPKEKIDVQIHNAASVHESDVSKFVSDSESDYNSIRVISPSDNVGEGTAHNWAVSGCQKKKCKYLFLLDAIVQITKPSLLVDLITQNRSIIAPMVKRHEKLWSNFWGALNKNGFYARSEDYMDIIEYKRVGLWNVPHITNAVLIQARHLPKLENAFTSNPELDPDMAFCEVARSKKIFMYVTNRDYWGHQVYADEFDPNHLHGELYEIFSNPLDWHNRYIHKNYSTSLQEDAKIEMPCPDVYWFPMVTDTFCDEFVAEMEHYGEWSDGGNKDPRLAGGYENVPTVDIHMKQVGLERHWLHFLDVYVRPLQEKVFTGYFHNPPNALLNFIVRYRPNEQALLRPHHDSSTYTINIALNRPGIDYQGGGCRFIRYNCSVTASRKGWMMMHPGRLTHYHEGLRTTEGTRYIMISFVDP